jgi:hypothetical protein
MDPNTTTEELGEAIDSFEQALERFVLDWYTKGVAVEGTWGVTVPVGDAPDWTIAIEKTYTAESSSYDPSFLED